MIYKNGNRGISLQNLADEFGVSKRTIRRDITNLSSVGFPIYDEVVQSRNKQVFYFIHPNYHIPEIQFSLAEIISMYLAYQTSGFKYGDAEEPLFSAIKKISSTIPEEMRKFLQKMEKDIIADDSFKIRKHDEILEKLQVIQQAIIKKKRVKFKYFGPKNKESITRTISPYGFKSHQNNFYLAGYCHSRKEIRIFALNRITNVRIQPHEIHEIEFDLESYFDSGFGVFSDELIAVKLKFSEKVAYFIKERIFHKDQKLSESADGSLILEMPAKGLFEIKRFVLSYGKEVQVLEPEDLKRSIKDEIGSISRFY
ncbi:MAG: transcriptional regulator [Candidatus Cloacimonetes bacterium]|nr:transcriptional regulator [Candidatus Cloacimonadota bacterium]